MTYTFTEKKRIRKSFAKRAAVLDVPFLLATQIDSYAEFLQSEAAPNARHERGLQAAFTSVFPISSHSGNARLEFVSFSLLAPAFDIVNKTMKIGDDLMWRWIDLLSFDIGVAEAARLKADIEAGQLNPRDVKLRLARELATRFHDAAAAETAIAGWHAAVTGQGRVNGWGGAPLTFAQAENADRVPRDSFRATDALREG